MQYHKLFEYCTTDCHCAIPKDCTAAAAAASPSTSIAVLFLALIASEVVIVVMCKTIAWYADAMFYSQQEDKKAAQSMQTQMWEKKSRDKPGQQGQDSACPICLIDFELGDLVSHGKSASCHSHVFHHECLSQWLDTHSTCPCCRRDLQKNVEESSPSILPWQRETDPTFCLFVF